MDNDIIRGALLDSDQDIQAVLRDFFQKTSTIFDAVMLPLRVPAGDSYAWILINDWKYVEEAVPIAPIMPVNAATAIKRLTRKGESNLKIAVLIRPCEVRATVELIKLNQINPENITICSYDCPGALPMQEYISNPESGEEKFQEVLQKNIWNSKEMKPVCQICDKFSLPAGDLHFGIMKGQVTIIANSEKGKLVLSELQLPEEHSLESWQKEINRIRESRESAKKETYSVIGKKVEGFDNLLDTFSTCIGCHNCQSACPICYCRQCYFDSPVASPNSDIIMMRAERRGSISLPLDRLMFHTGRMAHMSLSCVSCGSCSDACPVNIPVAKIFSFVGSQTQDTFQYRAGASPGDALPMKEYKNEEIEELIKLLSFTENREVVDG